MSITVKELPTSRDLTVDPKGSSVTLDYWAQSTNMEEDASDINDAAANASPDFYKNLVKKRIKSKPLGGGFWHVAVEYGRPEGADFPERGAGSHFDLDTPLGGGGLGLGPGLGFGLGFNTTGATQHITQSFETMEKVGDGADTKRAIGVSKDGVAGCDVPVSKFELIITRELKRLSMRYIHKMRKCIGHTNSDLWNTFEPHEALFLGCDAPVAQGGVGEILQWTLTYHFLIGDHEKDIHIGDLSPIKLKRAHDYLWVGYRADVEPTAGVVLQVPKHAYVERVTKSKSFAIELEF